MNAFAPPVWPGTAESDARLVHEDIPHLSNAQIFVEMSALLMLAPQYRRDPERLEWIMERYDLLSAERRARRTRAAAHN